MNIGGPSEQITNLMNSLASENFEQRLYFGACSNDERENINKIRDMRQLFYVSNLKRNINLFNDFVALLRIIQEVRTFQPDIIHTHTFKAGLIGRLAAFLSHSHAQLIHTYHGHLLYGYFGKAGRGIYILVERWLSKRTNLLISVGDQVRKDLIEVKIGVATKHIVIYPGINMTPLIPKNVAFETFQITPRSLNLTFLGRFTEIKRLDRIVALSRMVKDREFDIQFLLVGDGPPRQMYEKIVERENLPVLFLGWQENLSNIFSLTDALILVSDNEGTPISVIQAALVGIPAIATNVGSMKDIVIDGITGILTETDITLIFEAITHLYSQNSIIHELGSQAKLFAISQFDTRKFVNLHEKNYKKILVKSTVAPNFQV